MYTPCRVNNSDNTPDIDETFHEFCQRQVARIRRRLLGSRTPELVDPPIQRGPSREAVLPAEDFDMERRSVTRRQAVARSFLFAIGMALGKLDALKASGGQLTVDLDQWSHVVFRHNGKLLAVSTSDVFKALEDTYGESERRSSPHKEGQ